MKTYKWDKIYPYLVLFVFMSASIILSTHHELWYDEVRAWAIGASSNSFKDFADLMSEGEGHPYLWSGILLSFYRFVTTKVEVIKIIHLLISFTGVFLFLKYSAFNKIIKTLFVFSYLIFYEYSIISRNYALGILFIYIFCILYRNKNKNIILLAITLFFMGQTNIYSFMISCVFFVLLLTDFIADLRINFNKKNLFKFISYILIFFSSIVILVFQLSSQAIQGSLWGPTLSTIFLKTRYEIIQSIVTAAKQIIAVMLPLNDFNISFWGNNLIVDNLLKNHNIIMLIISASLIIIPIIFLKKRKIFFYFLGIISLLFIPIFIYVGQLRHYGHIFVFMISLIWISGYNDGDKYIIKKHEVVSNFKNIFLVIILSCGIMGSISAFYFDYKYPFSVQKNIASYISKNFEIENLVLSGYKDVDSGVVSAYLNKKIYYPQTDEFSFVTSSSRRITDLNADEVFIKSLSFGIHNDQILLITSNKLLDDKNLPLKYFFNKINVDFGPSIVGYEDAGLFLFERNKINFLQMISKENYKNAELNNCTISPDLKKIVFSTEGDALKLFKIPLEFEDDTNYLIEFDILINSQLDSPVQIDFYGENYDNDEQEFAIKPLEIETGKQIRIREVLNTASITDKDTFFRIFTFSPINAEITNLDIYKIEAKN